MTTTYAIPSTEALLSSARQQLENSHDGDQTWEQLRTGLQDLRPTLQPEEWADLRKQFAQHPIRRTLHQSPFSRRAFEKPRGYAGDAVMLDYIYGHALPAGLTNLGRRILQFETTGSSCRSVCQRCDILADAVDATAARHPSPRVLSVACGHLREAQKSAAVRANALGEYIAFDQDDDSLALVRSEQAGSGIRTVQGSVRDILRGKAKFPGMDLIYSAGLYDYLNLRTAQRLTALLYSMLAPGGTLLVANFAPNLPDIGYMEVCMDWDLIYRDESDMLDVTAEIPWEAGRRMFREPEGNIVFVEITRP